MEPCKTAAACVVCRVFGYAPTGESEFGWAGKVRFFDSLPAANWSKKRWADPLPKGNARLHSPDRGLHNSFYYAKDASGRITDEPLGWKVYPHSKSLSPTHDDFDPGLIVRPGEKFRFKVEFENLTEEELWVFYFALTLTHQCERHPEPVDLCHKLGYGKALGLGSCKITTDPIERLNTRRYFGETAAAFEFPPCELDKYLKGAPVRVMMDVLDFGKAADCVRFPDHNWFRANSTASIGEWERELARHPPRDFPVKRPVRQPPPQPTSKPQGGGPIPLQPAFPKHIEVEITSVGKSRGKAEFEGQTWTCQIVGGLYPLSNGDRTVVEVQSVDRIKKKFSGRRIL